VLTAAALTQLRAAPVLAAESSPLGLDEQNHVVRLTTLEWPPYNSNELPEQGVNTAVVRAAFAAIGYKLEIGFYPWSRTVALAQSDPAYVGYFPEYYADRLRQSCWLSDPAGSGPLGLAERKDHPVVWNNIEDLAAYRIGVVQDYVNTADFDARVASGRQRVDIAMSDETNLKKLAVGRVPLAIIDPRVFAYLVRHSPDLRSIADKLQMNAHLLDDKPLYVCFRRDANGERAMKLFNDGVKKIDVPAVIDHAWRAQMDVR
jgi:polar amino acid transport system substrate-binding protein